MAVDPETLPSIHQGDCVEWLASLRDGSVDLVFADPPFNIDYSYDVYDDKRSDEDYLNFCRDWIGGVHRALKSDGTFWLAIGDEYAAELKILSQQLGFHCRSWVIWYYTFGVNNRKGFSRSHTHLFHFVKDPKKYTFNLDNPAIRVASARQLVYADPRANSKGRLPDNTWILRPQDAPPGSFAMDHDTWFYSRVAGTFKERQGFHGCQMPEQLLGRIIRLCSRVGDRVADPFGGSGTTLVTAKKLGRFPAGCELSAEYVTKIRERLQNCATGDPLDGPVDPIASAPKTGAGRRRSDVFDHDGPPPINAETQSEIRQAYEIAGDGMPPRIMLCHPDRRQAFAAECKRRRLNGDSRLWNHSLLAVIESPEFDDISRWVDADLHDRMADGAEAAMRLVSVDFGLDVDGVLCSDAALDLFDQMASSFAPDPQIPADDWRYRLAGCKRHACQTGNSVAAEKWQSIGKIFPDQLDSVGGIYMLRTRHEILYAGATDNLGRRLSRVCSTPAWIQFQLHQIAVLVDGGMGERNGWIQKHQPMLNLPIQRAAAASPQLNLEFN